MRDSGTPPAALAAMALNGRRANGAAPEKGPRGVNKPAGVDIIEAARARQNGFRGYLGGILSNPQGQDIAENVRAHQAVAR